MVVVEIGCHSGDHFRRGRNVLIFQLAQIRVVNTKSGGKLLNPKAILVPELSKDLAEPHTWIILRVDQFVNPC